jgi:cyclopropane fatty-acyl-phospholipid synthase-like methyltransferase
MDLIILLVIWAVFLTFFILPVVILWFISIVGSGAPFVPVPSRAVLGIVDALELFDGAVVYDMGCGDGRVLLAAIQKNPNIRAIGIEKALLPYVIARWRVGGTRIEIRRRNFFKETFADATHVVTYLFPTLMERVEKKLDQELKPGTRIVAIDFPLEHRKPTRTVEQKLDELKRGTTLYIYD